MPKYLDNDGLLYFWQKIKNTFAARADVPSAGTANPKMDGTAAAGTSAAYAREDHVHPRDTTKANLASPTFTGTPKAPTAAAGTNTTQIATTAFVKNAIDLVDYSVFTGASSSSAGGDGMVPAPAKLRDDTLGYDCNKVLMADGSWRKIVMDVDVTSDPDAVWFYLYDDSNSKLEISKYNNSGRIPLASSGNMGVMSAADKTKLDGIAEGANAYTHPTYTSKTSGLYKITVDGTGHVSATASVAAADIPALPASKITSGTLGVARGGTGAGTLTGIVKGNGTSAMSAATASDVVTLLGTNAVNRATADASGNNIANTYAKKTDIAGMYKYKGSVAAEANLPTSGQTTGDVYNIESASSYGAAGANVAWNGTAWDSLGEVFQIASITNSEIDTIVAS